MKCLTPLATSICFCFVLTHSANAQQQTGALRANSRDGLSTDEVKEMLVRKGFYDSRWNETGIGVENQFEPQTVGGDRIVVDHTTGLMWQQAGSTNAMTYPDALNWVADLKTKGFAGYHDWRLPTLEEAMSLIEVQKHGDLYINSMFDQKQQWIWAADKHSAGWAWGVFFYYGYCYLDHVGGLYVRAVRVQESISEIKQPTKSSRSSSFNGLWGGTTSQGKSIYFGVRDNALTGIAGEYNFKGNICDFNGNFIHRSGGPLPQISADKFFAEYRSGMSQLFFFEGAFSSDTTASGTISFTFDASPGGPPCIGQAKATWSAKKTSTK